MEHTGNGEKTFTTLDTGFVIAMSGKGDLPSGPGKTCIVSSLSRHKMILLPGAYSDRNGWLNGNAAREGPQLIDL